MSKVKTYKGHTVPDGATHYQGSGKDHYEGFFKLSDDGWLFANAGFSQWHGQKAFKRSLSSYAIKLPEEEDNQEWADGLPPIGSKCLFKYHQGGEPLKLLIMGYFEDLVWATEDHCTIPYSASHRTIITSKGEFRPLKTQKEIEREEFHLKAFEIHKHDMSCNEFATALFNAGFTAPKGDL